jgi:hypothetical protein
LLACQPGDRGDRCRSRRRVARCGPRQAGSRPGAMDTPRCDDIAAPAPCATWHSMASSSLMTSWKNSWRMSTPLVTPISHSRADTPRRARIWPPASSRPSWMGRWRSGAGTVAVVPSLSSGSAASSSRTPTRRPCAWSQISAEGTSQVMGLGRLRVEQVREPHHRTSQSSIEGR